MSAPGVVSLTFDYSTCRVVALVDPGPEGETMWVKLWRITDGQKEFVGFMSRTNGQQPQTWIYQFQGGIPAGEYEAEAKICIIQIVFRRETTSGGPCSGGP